MCFATAIKVGGTLISTWCGTGASCDVRMQPDWPVFCRCNHDLTAHCLLACRLQPPPEPGLLLLRDDAVCVLGPGNSMLKAAVRGFAWLRLTKCQVPPLLLLMMCCCR